MSKEKAPLRAITFIDGQNLFHAVREAFGYSYPNYDVKKLSEIIVSQEGWDLKQVRFYTGIPTAQHMPQWHRFWSNKLAAMGRQDIKIFKRHLKERHKTIKLQGMPEVPDGTEYSFVDSDEKGIDVRIAIDAIRLAYEDEYDVALIFSQDQDLAEVATEIRRISNIQNRFIKIASAFPVGTNSKNTRGIDKTDWIKISDTQYKSCIDTRDYR